MHYRELVDSTKKATTDSSCDKQTGLVECTSCQKKCKRQKKLKKHSKKVHICSKKEEEVEDFREESKKTNIDRMEKNLEFGGMEK